MHPRPTAWRTRVSDSHGVYMVPAFVGLGAPHWDPDARAAIFGLTLDASGAHLARAALESVGYQTLDLMNAMAGDGARPSGVRIDGGMTANSWLCQFLADILQLPIERPRNLETTALGAAFLAGLATRMWRIWMQSARRGSARIVSNRPCRPSAGTNSSPGGGRQSRGLCRRVSAGVDAGPRPTPAIQSLTANVRNRSEADVRWQTRPVSTGGSPNATVGALLSSATGRRREPTQCLQWVESCHPR